MMASNTNAQIAPSPSAAPVGTSAAPNHAAAATNTNSDAFDIIDFRQEELKIDFPADIRKGLSAPVGTQKTLPTLLVYDEPGLQLFQDITYLDEYYLTNAEIDILEQQASSIADEIEPGSIILELGSGNLRKVNILLQALEDAAKAVDYYALDVDYNELVRTLRQSPTNFKHVRYHGLHASYDDGKHWLQQPELKGRHKFVLSLGSSIGNFEPKPEAAKWIQGFAEALEPHDKMLVAIDGCKESARVHAAYNDCKGVTHRFTMNALKHANRLLGEDVFDLEVWHATGEYDSARSCHRACVAPRRDVEVLGARVKAGERVRLEESHKYDTKDLATLWHAAGVTELKQWSVGNVPYAMHLIAKKQHALPREPLDYAAGPVPTLDEWHGLWKLWDDVTLRMIPNEELFEKPIKLRNACIFYLGHIPTFFDIKLTHCTRQPNTEPKYYVNIFERGIDPDVDNPEQCHAHSEVPDNWPDLKEILDYQNRVRERVEKLYADGSAHENQLVARCMWLGYEHEAMHLETLLYMLIQSNKTHPPPGVTKPDFLQLEYNAQKHAIPNKWFDIPAQEFTINMEDPETEKGPKRYFGWDIEKPPHSVKVGALQAQARPITNGEYAEYMLKTGIMKLPASWITLTLNGHASPSENLDDAVKAFVQDKAVRTVFGAVPLEYALSWPVSASYEELSGCAAYMGGRIPTFEETRSIYLHAETLRRRNAAYQANATMIPAVNNHLTNDGVPESPPAAIPLTNGRAGPNPHDTFVSLKDKNVGFQEWCPISVIDKGDELQGQGGMGGLWEWTSTPLSKHDGFEPMPLYEAYSRDFFDGKHNIVLGGSWATVPRIAGRKSFVNWYQFNYLYVWAGARVVRDI